MLDWEWKTSKSVPNKTFIHSFAVIAYQDEFLITGGFDNYGVTVEIMKFNPLTEIWSLVGNLESGRYGHSAVILNDQLYVIGGSSNSEICEIKHNFTCLSLANTKFEKNDFPKPYDYNPQECDPGN